MPDDESSAPPVANPDSQFFPPTPDTPLPQQGVVSTGSTANSDQTSKSSAQLAKEVHWIQHATFWSQVGLGVIGLLALWIYWGQLCVMRGQLGEIIKQYPELKKSADAATVAASSAQNAANTEREALISVQRAYVFADSAFLTISRNTEQTMPAMLQVSANWENAGTTPTRNLLMHGSWEYMPSALPSNFNFPDLGEGAEAGPHAAVLGPKATLNGSRVKIPFPIEEDMADGKTRLYMWGWATYHDAFPSTKLHITEYCWEVNIYRVSGTRQGPDVIESGTTFCPRHNCYDDECKAR